MPDNITEEYVDWKTQYNRQSEDLLNDMSHTMQMTPEQRQAQIAVRNILGRVDKETLKKEADRFIAQQQLEKVANAYGSPQKAEEIKQMSKVQGIEINTFELDFLIADSLQRIEASEDPKAEYFDWIETQLNIENNINSGGTTQDEIDARNNFLVFLDDRETEMRRIIALYAGTAVYGNNLMKEMAMERLAFMNFKMSELRRLRSRTQATKSQADVKEKDDNSNNRFASRALAVGVAVVAHENAMHRFLRDKSGIDSRAFERGVGEEFVRFRPVTMTRAQAEQKILTAKENMRQTAKVLTDLRYGKTQEDVEREKQEERRRKLMIMRNGFRVADFRRLRNDDYDND